MKKKVKNSVRSRKRNKGKTNKVTKPVSLPQQQRNTSDGDSEAGYMSSEDVEFVEEEMKAGRLGFLSRLNIDAQPKSKKRRVQEEEDFESLPRQPVWAESKDNNEDLHYLLPLKHKKGLIHQNPIKLEEIKGNEDQFKGSGDIEKGSGDESEGSDSDQEGSDGDLPTAHLSAAQIMLLREKRLHSKKAKMANLSSRILEDPQTNISLLNKLRRMCDELCPEIALTIKKLAMVSLLTIYKDIVPGYSIRELSAAEKSVKVSKDVKRLRDFEQSLVSNYKQYISLLVETAKDEFGNNKRKRSETPSSDVSSSLSVGEVAVQCLCGLASSLGHFNFHGEVFNALVQWMATPSTKVSQMCCKAIEGVFENDPVGNVTLEIVQLMTKMIKGRGYNVKNEVVRTFLSLQLQSVEEPVNQLGGVSRHSNSGREEKMKRKMEAKKMSRKQRRKLSLRNKVERELRETEVEERQDRKSKLQTECIKLVFFVYFRVLKFNPDSHLLSDVLEGLAKYSHLISVDYFSDLMAVLQQIMEKQTLSPCNTLRCIYTCFEILSGQGEALNIDPRTFYCQLYTNILHLDFYSAPQDAMLVVRCLEKMIKKRRQVSVQRICSFIKRLSSISLQLSPGVALAVMATVRLFMQSYPNQSNALLEYEDTPCGVFDPEIPDPELGGAQSTFLWELSTLTKHFDPHVAGYAHHLIRGAPSQGAGALSSSFSRRSGKELMDDHSWPVLDPMTGVNTKLTKKAKLTSHSTIEEYTEITYVRTMVERADRLIDAIV